MNKIIKRIKKDSKPILIALISLIALIIGSIAINFIAAFLIVLLIDIIILVVSKPKNKKKKNPKETLKTVLIVCFCCAILGLTMGLGFGAYIITTAPDFTEDRLYDKDASFLYMDNGEEYAKLGEKIRKKISYDNISESLIDAIVATEDSRFFQHSGVDLPRFLKASISQVLGKGGGGASTLTMQVSKNAFTSTEDKGLKGIIRKFTDIYISVFKIETHYTKEQIVEFYVNSNYLGGGNNGIEQASLDYFGKSANELNVAEAAMIAGLFQAPNALDPYINPTGCEARRKTVLSLMLRHGYITEEEYEIAKTLTVEKLLVKNETKSTEYQDFIDTVVAEVIRRTGLSPYNVPMKIYTTMNKDMQTNMNNVMSGNNYTWKNSEVQAGSAVIDVKTGAITAIGAGRNRVVRGDNFAIDIKRQIGSTAKPLYDYGPGIEYNNWSTYTPFTDEPYAYSDGTKLRNWDNKYAGFTTMHDALKYSRNIPAIKAFQQIKNSNIKTFVTNLGLSPESNLHEAHAIGGYTGESPLTVAAAYAAFSNGGYYVEPHSFTKIVYTETGETYEVKPTTKKAMSAETAYMITKILEDTSGYAVGLSVNGVNYAAKTGTTNLDNDTIREHGLPSNAIMDKWIASYNDTYAIAVWYGYKYLNKEHYLTTADNSVKNVFQAIAKGVYKSKSSWTKPDGVVEIEVEDELPTAMLASPFTPSNLRIKAYFKKGFEPTETSERFSQLPDVTNLNYNETTNTLYWSGITTPKFIDTNYLNQLYSSMYTDESTKQNKLNERYSYNNNNIGTIVYNVYKKDSSGNLKLLTTTNTTQFVYPVIEPTTFVVKASYSIFKDNMSGGVEYKVNESSGPINNDIKVSQVGKYILNTSATKEELIEAIENGIMIKNGDEDITSKATITISIKNSKGDNLNINEVVVQEDVYTIDYNIKINSLNYSTTFKKTITIKE